MLRIAAFLLLAMTMAACAGKAGRPIDSSTLDASSADGAIVLRVKVTEVDYTDMHPGCADDDECIPTYFWYRYRARVRDVVAGAWTEREVEFVHLQHAEYLRKLTKDCYVVLRPAGTELQAKTGVPLVADRFLFGERDLDKASIEAFRDEN